MASKLLLGVAGLLVLAVPTSFSLRAARVPVVHAVERQVVQTVAASGQVAGRDESDVGAEISGRLAHVYVWEGDRVRRGQLLARIENRLLESQLKQAQAALATAEWQLRQARRTPLPSEFALAEAETAQSERSSREQLRNTEKRLLELTNGATREDIEQARGAVRAARFQNEQNLREKARLEELVSDGFVTRQDYERGLTALQVSQANLYTAEQRLHQLLIGTRAEQVAQARAQMGQAQENWHGYSAARAARLQNLRDQPRAEDVKVAACRLEEARWNLTVTREKLRQAEVRAPYDGLVTRLLLKAGQDTATANPILHLVRMPLELQVDVDENNLGRLQVGQEALISCDAYPARFKARLREVAPQVVNERGTVQLKLDPLDPPAWLRPGQTVSVNIFFDQGRKLPVLPLSSVSTVGKRNLVLVLENGHLAEREIEVGAAGPTGFPILRGVGTEDRVVLDPTRWKAGQSARGVEP